MSYDPINDSYTVADQGEERRAHESHERALDLRDELLNVLGIAPGVVRKRTINDKNEVQNGIATGTDADPRPDCGERDGEGDDQDARDARLPDGDDDRGDF